MKIFTIFFGAFGLLMIIITLTSFTKQYLIYKNGVKAIGIIKSIETNKHADSPDDVFYTFNCLHKDSNYIIKQNFFKTDFIVNDSVTIFFYPNDLNKRIFIFDSRINKGNYLGFLIGLILFILSVILHREL